MSELINAKSGRNDLHWKLLASVSALALIGNLFATVGAKADDTGQPNVWIELGGQLEQFASTQDPFTPLFLQKTPPAFETVTPVEAQKPPRFAIGGDAKATFEPGGTNWVFSASVRYGRSNGNKTVHQQTEYPNLYINSTFHFTPEFDNYATTKVRHDESHAIVDFQAGKDFGLGMFGRGGTSTFSLGVRYAQFASKTTVNIHERPDLHLNDNVPTPSIRNKIIKYFHSYGLTGNSTRSFRGIGPSLSWDGSAPLFGKPEATEFTFDWGVNAAILFGRQRAAVSHHTSGRYVEVANGKYLGPGYQKTPLPRNSARSIAMPNLGVFGGVSLKWPNAKVSLGYRADFFFGAVDGGIDKRVSKTLGLNGPFASISIGL